MNRSLIQKVWICKQPNVFDGEGASGEPSSPPMTSRHPDGKEAPHSQRLRRLREAMGYEVAADFAQKFLGISVQRWNNVENGYPLSAMLARLLTSKIPGISLDWLDAGNPNGLSVEMARKLGEIPAAPTKSERRPHARK